MICRAVRCCLLRDHASCELRECLMNDRLSGILEKLKASDDTSLPTGSGKLLPPKVLEQQKALIII